MARLIRKHSWNNRFTEMAEFVCKGDWVGGGGRAIATKLHELIWHSFSLVTSLLNIACDIFGPISTSQ